jgi:branched-chain amino acid transport system permease protein
MAFPSLVLSAILALVVLATSGASSALQDTTTTMLVRVVLVVGLYIFIGNSGILSFGHISFVAIGAYVGALLTIPVHTKSLLLPDLPWLFATAHLPASVAALVAALAAAAFALVVSAPVMRLDGIAASLATFAVLVVVNTVVRNWTSVTGGTGALIGVPTDISTAAALMWAIAAIAVADVFQRSRPGLRLRASREDDVAAMAMGVNVPRERRRAFVLSAFVVGVAGSLYAHVLGSFSADAFYLDITFMTLAMLVVGGIDSLAGAVIGTVVISWLLEGLRIVERGTSIGPVHIPARAGLQEVGLALALLLVVLIRPSGLMGGREISWPNGGVRRRPRN